MSNFNKKKTYKRFIYSPVSLFLLLVVLLVFLKALWGVYQKEKISAEYLLKEQIDLDKITERQKSLAQSVEYMKTDKGIESEIRSKFHVVKEGELVAVIVDNDASNTSDVSTTTIPASLWQKFWELFGF